MPVSRRQRRNAAIGLGVAALLLALASLGGSARAASVLLVDDDGAQCPTAGYTAIADAIAAADPGDTIVVCPGSYPATTVDQRVTLSGYTGDLSTVNRCTDRLHRPADETTKDSIVAGFTVTEDFVTIKGFTLTNPGGDGVMLPDGTDDAWITRNVFQDSSVGVNLNGTMSLVDHNCIRDNNAAGPAAGTGIYSDQGLRSATIDGNVFAANAVPVTHDGAAITLLDTAGTGSLDAVTVKNNVSILDGDLISIAGSTNSRIAGNASFGAFGSGIYLEAGDFGPNVRLAIADNSIGGGGDEGIYADVDSLTHSKISGTRTKGNATFGIHLDTGNTHNAIKNNSFANGGSENDCQDDSAPANSWKNDRGKSADPSGICKKK